MIVSVGAVFYSALPKRSAQKRLVCRAFLMSAQFLPDERASTGARPRREWLVFTNRPSSTIASDEINQSLVSAQHQTVDTISVAYESQL
mmetsp:Transcript_16781/g.32695  ORF Transcript_16781/g.32695 Transcript_16781/m.32695 type:complete len:89 (-) Transcript_16781:423-689(-)